MLLSQLNGAQGANAQGALDGTPANPRVGLIIVDFNSWPETRTGILSALNSDHPFEWIIVVDNGGTVPENECRACSQRVVLIRAQRNGGFAYGVNLGLRRLKRLGATHAMLLNPDARLREETLGTLFAALQQNPEIGIVSPVVYRDELKKAIEFSGARALWHLGWFPARTTLRNVDLQAADEPYVMGCCWLIKMAIFDEIGEMPEGYFLYFEETDYCQSVKKRGYRLAVVQNASVIHLGSWTIGKYSPLFRYQLARNRIWFMRRWSRWDQYASFLLFTGLIKVPLAILIFGIRDCNWPALSAFLKGSWHGLTLPVFSSHQVGQT